MEYPPFKLKSGPLFDENDIVVQISSQFQLATEFCGGLFSASLNLLLGMSMFGKCKADGLYLAGLKLPIIMTTIFFSTDTQAEKTVLG